MKISITDECNGKFTTDLKEHWEKTHEVIFDKYFDPQKILWADVCFFDFAGNNVQRASYPDDSFWEKVPQPQNKNVVLRVHDIDLWVGQHTRVNYDWINNLIFVAPHFKERFLPDLTLPEKTKVHLIQHGINLKKFVYREKPRGNKMVWIHNINHAKNIELALQVLVENPSYELYIVGKTLGSWEKIYVEEFVKRNNLKFFYQEWVDDINQFLQDKDFALLTSAKEAFSFFIGESMAVGLKPLIHNYPGAKQVWPEKYIWNKVSEVRPMLEGEYNPKEYREHIEQTYPLDKMLRAYDSIINPQ